MFRQDMDQEDLRSEIFQLKKQNFNFQSENSILKVKLRKLREECLKKEKQIMALLDPHKNVQFRKMVTDRGAHMLINLKEKNDKLERLLLEKDAAIRKMQNKLGTLTSYFEPQRKQISSTIPRCHTDITLDNRLNVRVPQVVVEQKADRETTGTDRDTKDDNRSAYQNKQGDNVIAKIPLPRTPEFSVISTTLLEQVKELRKGVHRNEDGDSNKLRRDEYNASPIDHLLTLMEALHSSQESERKVNSPASDLDRAELLCETPHEEIQQLQQYFFSMLTEVEKLKVIIEKLQQDQQRTDAVLKTKDCNMKKLADEVKSIKTKRAHSASNAGKASKAKIDSRGSTAKCRTVSKKNTSSKQSLVSSTNLITASKSSLTTTSEEENIECPFYRDYMKCNKQKEAKTSAKPELKKLWVRQSANSKLTEESMEIRMPMIEETTTPHSNETDTDSVASVQEELDNKPCKKSESL